MSCRVRVMMMMYCNTEYSVFQIICNSESLLNKVLKEIVMKY